ncbi:hypothetical protein ACJX0J_034978, partial [Zea mays]
KNTIQPILDIFILSTCLENNFTTNVNLITIIIYIIIVGLDVIIASTMLPLHVIDDDQLNLSLILLNVLITYFVLIDLLQRSKILTYFYCLSHHKFTTIKTVVGDILELQSIIE